MPMPRCRTRLRWNGRPAGQGRSRTARRAAPSLAPTQPRAALRGQGERRLRLPGAGDGERALPHAWRQKHRAAHARGLARLAAAHTTHGYFTAAARAGDLHRRTLVSRIGITCAATMLEAFLPPDLAARLAVPPPDLDAPVHPSNAAYAAAADNTPCNGRRDARGRFVARARLAARGRTAEREAARREAAEAAPWHAAIRQARLAERAARQGARAAARAARGQQPMQRAAVRAVGTAAGSGSAACHGVPLAVRGQQPMQRATERSAGMAAGPGSAACHGVPLAVRGQQPMQRAKERSAGIAAGSGSAACHGVPLAVRGQQPMQRATEWSAGTAAGSGSAGGPGVPLAARGQQPWQRATERSAGMAAGPGSATCHGVPLATRGQQPLQRATERSAGTAAGSEFAGGPGVPLAVRGQQPTQRATERLAGMAAGSRPVTRQGAPLAEPVGPFRRGLLSGTARSKPIAKVAAWRSPAVHMLAADDAAAQHLAAQAERAGEWTVVMAILEAQKADRDWRLGVAEARRRMKQDADRFAAHCMPWGGDQRGGVGCRRDSPIRASLW